MVQALSPVLKALLTYVLSGVALKAAGKVLPKVAAKAAAQKVIPGAAALTAVPAGMKIIKQAGKAGNLDLVKADAIRKGWSDAAHQGTPLTGKFASFAKEAVPATIAETPTALSKTLSGAGTAANMVGNLALGSIPFALGIAGKGAEGLAAGSGAALTGASQIPAALLQSSTPAQAQRYGLTPGEKAANAIAALGGGVGQGVAAAGSGLAQGITDTAKTLQISEMQDAIFEKNLEMLKRLRDVQALPHEANLLGQLNISSRNLYGRGLSGSSGLYGKGALGSGYAWSDEELKKIMKDEGGLEALVKHIAAKGGPSNIDEMELITEAAGNMDDDTDFERDGDIWKNDVLDKYADFVHNYMYKYNDKALELDPSTDTEKVHIGPMAQDLEKVNPATVINDPKSGYKSVDTGRLALMNAGAIADLAREVREIKNAG